MKEPDWDDEPYEDVLLSKDESTAIARVVCWAFGSNEEVIENWNANPILNTLVYKCEFDLMMARSRNTRPMLLLPIYMRKEMLTDFQRH